MFSNNGLTTADLNTEGKLPVKRESLMKSRTARSPGLTFCADSYFGIRSTPGVTVVARKDPDHSARNAGGRLQLNTHTPYECGFASSDMVHGCMVYTEHAPRRQQFHVASAMPAL